jgi:phosphatidylserine/phosphatidylglycerophosphate/cardiolipin synthase-like enzyme
MIRKFLTIGLLLLGFASSAFAYQTQLNCAVDTEFSPNGGGEALVVSVINSAQHQILVQAYNFTDPAILNALFQAKMRGVDVRLILDKSNEEVRYENLILPFVNAHVPVFTDYTVAIAHNKVMIIDQQTVITGSFNFTVSAQHRNAENVNAFYNCPAFATLYVQNWTNRLSVSRPWTPRQQVQVTPEQ